MTLSEFMQAVASIVQDRDRLQDEVVYKADVLDNTYYRDLSVRMLHQHITNVERWLAEAYALDAACEDLRDEIDEIEGGVPDGVADTYDKRLSQICTYFNRLMQRFVRLRRAIQHEIDERG